MKTVLEQQMCIYIVPFQAEAYRLQAEAYRLQAEAYRLQAEAYIDDCLAAYTHRNHGCISLFNILQRMTQRGNLALQRVSFQNSCRFNF